MSAVYAPGTRLYMELGSDQDRTLAQLRAAVRHPSRTWHRAPTMRELDRWPSVAHRAMRRLVSLGIIAVQTSFGVDPKHPGRPSFVRFTFGVRFWRRGPFDRRGLARMRAAAGSRPVPIPGQLVLLAAPEPPPPRELEPPRYIHGGSMAPTRYERCARCGHEGPVRAGLFRVGLSIEHGLRCVDHVGCDARVSAS